MSKPKRGPFADEPILEILADVPYGGMEDRSLARDYLLELAARVERVLALHVEAPQGGVCHDCDYLWPCPTVRILDGEEL